MNSGLMICLVQGRNTKQLLHTVESLIEKGVKVIFQD